MPKQSITTALLAALGLSILPTATACGQAADQSAGPNEPRADQAVLQFEKALRQLEGDAASLEDLLLPVRLLRPNEEDALRKYPNAQHLARARSLGVPPLASQDDADRHLKDTRLVRLDEDSPYWTVRRLDHSLPYATPDVRALLTELGRRFHAELANLKIPPLRLEVSSALRTAASQASLQQTNENAARDRSPHEYGTTVDIAYDGFAAPQQSVFSGHQDVDAVFLPALGRMETVFVERVAARKSRELQAILGRILHEMQNEGKVLVTLERLQPVYHLTVAKRY